MAKSVAAKQTSADAIQQNALKTTMWIAGGTIDGGLTQKTPAKIKKKKKKTNTAATPVLPKPYNNNAVYICMYCMSQYYYNDYYFY